MKKAAPLTKLVLFDLDGTIYLDGKLIKGAKQFLKKLDRQGLDYAFMTNNSSVAPPQYLKKLRNLGLNARRQNVLTSCQATCLMLADLNIGPDLYILGTRKFQNYLKKQGYNHTNQNPAAVLIGFDRELTFAKFATALQLIDKGTPLLASHPDMCCPSADGPLPDAGCILAAIKAATGVKPQAIAGKPHKWIVQLAAKNFNVKPNEITIVGDRLQTDIKMANRYKMKSVLVLSGVTKRPDLKTSPFKPTRIANSIADLNKEFPL